MSAAELAACKGTSISISPETFRRIPVWGPGSFVSALPAWLKQRQLGERLVQRLLSEPAAERAGRTATTDRGSPFITLHCK